MNFILLHRESERVSLQVYIQSYRKQAAAEKLRAEKDKAPAPERVEVREGHLSQSHV